LVSAFDWIRHDSAYACACSASFVDRKFAALFPSLLEGTTHDPLVSIREREQRFDRLFKLFNDLYRVGGAIDLPIGCVWIQYLLAGPRPPSFCVGVRLVPRYLFLVFSLMGLTNMRKLTKKYVFQKVYDMAALVEECAENDESFSQLDWEDPSVIKSVATFSKTTILHRYIFSMLAVQHRYEYRKNADLYEEEPGLIAELEDLLRLYDIKFVPFANFEPPIAIDQATTRDDYPFHKWFLSQQKGFEILWANMTDEVFHLLFGNRAFLLKFNLALANLLRNHEVAIPPEFRDDSSTMKQAFMPKWVRDAVFFRDHGRCVLCHADLSGLLSLDHLTNFDHIVPLAAWGS